MPNSLKCKIKHLCHNRTITESECDRILKALEQESILDNIRTEIEQAAFKDVSGSKYIFVNRINQIIDKYKEGGAG